MVGVLDACAAIGLAQEGEGVGALRLHLRTLFVRVLQTVDLLLVGVRPRRFLTRGRLRLVATLVRVVYVVLLNWTCSSHYFSLNYLTEIKLFNF